MAYDANVSIRLRIAQRAEKKINLWADDEDVLATSASEAPTKDDRLTEVLTTSRNTVARNGATGLTNAERCGDFSCSWYGWDCRLNWASDIIIYSHTC